MNKDFVVNLGKQIPELILPKSKLNHRYLVILSN